MDRVGVEDVKRALGEARAAAADGVLAFDADGTLWRGDVGDDFFRGVVAEDRFEPAAVEGMVLVAKTYGVDVAGADPADIATRLFDACVAGTVPEETICEVIAWACAGWRQEDVHALSRRVVEDGKLEERWHGEVVEVISWARSLGIEAFVVSASPRAIVEVAVLPRGFDPAHVIAVTPRFSGDRMLADVDRPIPYGPGKAELLSRALGRRALLGAFGDNVFDLPMLAMAKVGVVVQPKPKLLAHLRQEPAPALVQLALGSD